MISAKVTENEKERLSTLGSYSILDTLPEEDYDNITAIAAEICGTNISLISLIDDKRQWFKSHHGLGATETPKEYAFCAHAIINPHDVFVVQDARMDDRFRDNPLVTGDPHVIFYAGVPLVSGDGMAMGTLCVIDKTPKLLSKSQLTSLRALSKQVMNLFELRKIKADLESALESMEQKNRELEQFAFLAAHDIKSPLNNISLLASIVTKDHSSQMNPEGREWLRLIESSSKKLKGLIDGLLEYSRSEKVLKEEKTLVNFEALKNDIQGLFVVDNKCTITAHSDVREIVVNKTALEQVMINLVANAIKYNDKEIATIDLGATETDTQYEFSVQDNGPGISPENHAKIFQLYEIIQAKDKFGQAGNGIGLATVKKIVEAQGGSIHVDSTFGEGARFTFTVEK